MARIYEPFDEYKHGKLRLESNEEKNKIDVFYVPSRQRLEEAGFDPDLASNYQTKLLEIDLMNVCLTIFPIITLGWNPDFLKQKYNKIERITLADGSPVLSSLEELEKSEYYARSITFGSTVPIEKSVDEESILSEPESQDHIIEILESLPSIFVKDYDYGLGFAKPYRFIIEAVEELTNCTEIRISKKEVIRIDVDSGIFYISMSDLENLRKLLNRTTSMSQLATRNR